MRYALAALMLVGAVAFAADSSDETQNTAIRKELGCDRNCQLLSIERVRIRPGATDLAVRARRSGHCGTVADWTLLDTSLRPLLSIEEEVDRACGGAPEEHLRRRVTTVDGEVRAGGHVWRWNGERFVAR